MQARLSSLVVAMAVDMIDATTTTRHAVMAEATTTTARHHSDPLDAMTHQQRQ